VSERVTVRAPFGWRYPPQGEDSAVAADTMVDRLLALIRAGEGPASAELALWLAPAGLERVMSVASWLGAWAFQRPLFLHGVALGYDVPGADVLAFVASMQAELGPVLEIDVGHVKAPAGESIVMRYTWADVEPLVFARCPRVAAEGCSMPTELPPMPDAWRQEAADLAFNVAKAPATVALLSQWGPGRFDVGLDRTKRAAGPTPPSPTETSSASAGKTSRPAPTGPAGPSAPAPAASPPSGATTTGGTARPAAPGAVQDDDSLGGQMQEAMDELAERPIDRDTDLRVDHDAVEEVPPGGTSGVYVPIAVVLCVLCRHSERLKLADVVERFKGGCLECKKDPGALVVTEEENGTTTPLVHFLRAAGIFDPKVPIPAGGPSGAPATPSGTATPASPSGGEPKRRPSRKKAEAADGH
jgi:hypothetical protein